MTLSVVAAAQWGSVPQVVVDVTASPVVADELTVWRVHENGSRWQVLTTERAVITGTWSGIDYHPPLSQSFQYQAVAGSQTSDLSAATSLPSDVAWLIHPVDPALSLPLYQVLGPVEDVVWASRAKDSEVLKQRANRSIASPRGAASSALTVKVQTVDLDAIETFFADGGPVLFVSPWAPLAWQWIQPGDVTVSAPYGPITHQHRRITFPYKVCLPPDADVAAQWTLSDIDAAFATLDEYEAAYSTLRRGQLDLRG